MDKLVNFVLFQIGWFSAVIGGATNRPWLGVLVIIAVVLIHLYRTFNIRAEATLIIIIAIMGGSLDSVFVYLNWISYPSGHIHESLTAYWIIAMWMSFSTTLNSSMAWLKKSHILAVIFGFFGPTRPVNPTSRQEEGRMGYILFCAPVDCRHLPAFGITS